MRRETIQEYLARGGKITYCPPVGKKEKKKRSVTISGPDYDTRKQEVVRFGAKVNTDLIPVALKISLGIK